MKNKELKNATEQKTQKIQWAGKAENIRRGQTRRNITDTGLPKICNKFIPILSVGKESQGSNVGGFERGEKRKKTKRQSPGNGRRDKSIEGSHCRDSSIEYRVKKNAVNLIRYKRLSRVQKQDIVAYIVWMKERSGFDLDDVLKQLGLERNRYNYLIKSLNKPIEPRKRKKTLRLQKATPEEEDAVKEYVRNNPGCGYKRYTYMMLDDNIVALKEHQVYEIMKGSGLLLFGKRTSGIYKRPPKPTKPNEVWHIDIMYLWIYDRWFYLVDIIDGYSRFLVHWKLCTTMHANTVVETMQEAIDLQKADSIKPHIVHDNGKQFIGSLWTDMIEYNKLTDIKIRVHHPQSNGTVERLHRTHREECFNKDIESYAKAVEMMEDWAYEYNYKRVHSSLNWLTPADYYLGDPVKRLKDRKVKIDTAYTKRKEYWLNQCENLRLAI